MNKPSRSEKAAQGAFSMDRRDFMRLSAGLGVALPSAGALLSNRAGATWTESAAQAKTLGVMGVGNPYTAPPVGHFNTFVTTGAMILGFYWDLMEMPLASYKWASQQYIPQLATSWKLTPPDKFTVQLRKGVKWSDGSTFSPQDVVDTFTILHAQSAPAWEYLESVAANGPNEVVFKMSDPTTLIEYLVLRTNIRARSVYGELASRAQSLFASGADVTSPQFASFIKDLNAFRPPKMVASGPYEIDPKTVTGAQLTMNRVPTAWNAKNVNFRQLINYNGASTEQMAPLILAKKVMFATHGFSAPQIMGFHDAGIPTVKVPSYQLRYIMPNLARATSFADVRVRQAVALGIDRKKMVAANKLTDTDYQWITGLADNQSKIWLDKSNLSKLDPYKYNPAKANALMQQAGYKKVDGVWQSSKGENLEYDLLGVSSNDVNRQQQAATALTQFGIKTTLKLVDSTTASAYYASGNYDLAYYNSSGTGKPHPFFAFDEYYNTVNVSEKGGGMHFPLKQTTKALGAVDLGKLTLQSAEGLSETSQRAAIAKLAISWNELVPLIPLMQRIANVPTVKGAEVSGWPKVTNPLYQNSIYSDDFTTLWILDGTLKPSKKVN